MSRTVFDVVRDSLSEEHYVRLDDGVGYPVRFTVCTGRDHERVVLDAPQIYLTILVYQPQYCRKDM